MNQNTLPTCNLTSVYGKKKIRSRHLCPCITSKVLLSKPSLLSRPPHVWKVQSTAGFVCLRGKGVGLPTSEILCLRTTSSGTTSLYVSWTVWWDFARNLGYVVVISLTSIGLRRIQAPREVVPNLRHMRIGEPIATCLSHSSGAIILVFLCRGHF